MILTTIGLSKWPMMSARKYRQLVDIISVMGLQNICLKIPKCESSLSTYVWTPPTGEHWPLYHVRTFAGQIVTYKGGQAQVLMSTDNSLIIFVLKSRINECRQELIRTNYEDLVIMKLFNSDSTPRRGKIRRKLPPGEVSLASFITSRGDVLYNSAKGLIRKEFSQVIKDECLTAFETAKTNHFLERKMPEYQIFSIRWWALCHSCWWANLFLSNVDHNFSCPKYGQMLQRITSPHVFGKRKLTGL